MTGKCCKANMFESDFPFNASNDATNALVDILLYTGGFTQSFAGVTRTVFNPKTNSSLLETGLGTFKYIFKYTLYKFIHGM